MSVSTKFHMMSEASPTRTVSITLHEPGDAIAKALIAMPSGGPRVEINVDGDRHILHHWSIQTVGGEQRLVATWIRWADHVAACRIPTRYLVHMPPGLVARVLWRRLKARWDGFCGDVDTVIERDL